MEMNSQTCQLLATVLSLAMVTIVVERRAMRMQIRRRRWFRRGFLTIFTFSTISLGFAIAGTQLEGLTSVAAGLAWILSVASLLGFATITLASIASTEVDEDESGFNPYVLPPARIPQSQQTD